MLPSRWAKRRCLVHRKACCQCHIYRIVAVLHMPTAHGLAVASSDMTIIKPHVYIVGVREAPGLERT